MTLEQAKTGAALLGMALAVTGVVLGSRTVVWVAIAVIGVAMVLRVLIRRAAARATEESPVP